MIRFQYEQGNGRYARLNAIKAVLLGSGKFQIIREDGDSLDSNSTTTSKKIVLKYAGLRENVVLTESLAHHYLKNESGDKFVKTVNDVWGKKTGILFLYAHGFAILYGDTTMLGAYQAGDEQIVFSVSCASGSLAAAFGAGDERNGQMHLLPSKTFEGEKVAYFELPFSVGEDLKGRPLFLKFHQSVGINVPTSSGNGVVLFEQGGRFFVFPGASKIMMSLEGEGA